MCFGRQKFLADRVAIWKIFVSLVGILDDFLLKSNTKKICAFKVGQFKIFEKTGCGWNGKNLFTQPCLQPRVELFLKKVIDFWFTCFLFVSLFFRNYLFGLDPIIDPFWIKSKQIKKQKKHKFIFLNDTFIEKIKNI